jgi:hypothetical protein
MLRARQGPVSVSLTPDKADAPSPSRIAGFAYDRAIERVVVIGNGIAGVTAADHVRRRHPECAIDLVADEHHHLYNRMGSRGSSTGARPCRASISTPTPGTTSAGSRRG